MANVAVLIPVYNDQECLDLTLHSLPLETPLDIVVVDDGSDTPIRLPDVPHPHKVFLLRLEKNQGIEHALNHGLRWILNRGYAYVARLDAGDVALPGRFVKQLSFLEAHSDYALVGSQVLFVDESGREVFRERFPTDYQQIRRNMHARNCFVHPAVMLRTRVLREVGLYSDRFSAAEDYELFFRITLRNKVANLPDYVLKCRINPKGISLSRRRRQILSRLKVMLEYFDPIIKESYFGIIKNLVLLFMPVSLVQQMKRYFEKYRGWL